jgi:hypothetical protein
MFVQSEPLHKLTEQATTCPIITLTFQKDRPLLALPSHSCCDINIATHSPKHLKPLKPTRIPHLQSSPRSKTKPLHPPTLPPFQNRTMIPHPTRRAFPFLSPSTLFITILFLILTLMTTTTVVLAAPVRINPETSSVRDLRHERRFETKQQQQQHGKRQDGMSLYVMRWGYDS